MKLFIFIRNQYNYVLARPSNAVCTNVTLRRRLYRIRWPSSGDWRRRLIAVHNENSQVAPKKVEKMTFLTVASYTCCERVGSRCLDFRRCGSPPRHVSFNNGWWAGGGVVRERYIISKTIVPTRGAIRVNAMNPNLTVVVKIPTNQVLPVVDSTSRPIM